MTTPYFDTQASANTILSSELLQPDLLLPAQWNARSRPIMEPEAKLIWAIFDAAWHELLRPRDRRSAEVWFANPNYRNKSGFSLGEVCDYLNWDTDTVREAARARVTSPASPTSPNRATEVPAVNGDAPEPENHPDIPSAAPDGPEGRLRACGHPFTFANSYRRNCLICHRARARAYKRKISVPNLTVG